MAIIACATVVAVLILGGAGWLLTRPDTYTLTVTVEATGTPGDAFDYCQPPGVPNPVPIQVTDEHGTLIGSATADVSGIASSCSGSVRITGLPKASFYSIEVTGALPAANYSFDQLQADGWSVTIYPL